jgi:UDP-glucose 4-epimerase
MKCLVTGGAGFIGSNLVRLLLAEGHAVRVLDDLSSGTLENLKGCQAAELIVGAVTDRKTVDKAVLDSDAVFHLASSVGHARSIADPLADATVNVLGTLQVLKTVRKHHVHKMVFSSSAAIFGKPDLLPILEKHSAEPDSPYGASKLCAEKQCLAYARLYGIDIVCLRYFNVYGPHQRHDPYGGVIPIFLRQLLRGEPLTVYGEGNQTRDFVSVHDVVRANLLAATTANVSGAYNIGSGKAMSIHALARLMANENKFKIEYKPPRPGDSQDSVAGIAKAQAAFGYMPTVRLADGLAEYIAWAKAENL